MITVKHTEGRIIVIGHANYDEHGKDIVCAAVSTLLQVFVASVEELTHDEIKASMAAGNALIQYGKLSEKGKTLLASFLLGVQKIAERYPNNVKAELSGNAG